MWVSLIYMGINVSSGLNVLMLVFKLTRKIESGFVKKVIYGYKQGLGGRIHHFKLICNLTSSQEIWANGTGVNALDRLKSFCHQSLKFSWFVQTVHGGSLKILLPSKNSYLSVRLHFSSQVIFCGVCHTHKKEHKDEQGLSSRRNLEITKCRVCSICNILI